MVRGNKRYFILSLYGLFTGHISAAMVVLFRYLIESFSGVRDYLFQLIKGLTGHITIVLSVSGLLFMSFILVGFLTWLGRKEPNISGSGIPDVEGYIQGSISFV